MTPCRRTGSSLLLFVLMSGCSKEQAAVKGTVTLDGEPVGTGHIYFVPVEGTPGSGMRVQILAGHYVADSASRPPAGVYRVEISAIKKTGKKVEVGSPAPKGTMADEEVEAIPEKYNKNSTLRQELKGGSNICDFPLTTK